MYYRKRLLNLIRLGQQCDRVKKFPVDIINNQELLAEYFLVSSKENEIRAAFQTMRPALLNNTLIKHRNK